MTVSCDRTGTYLSVSYLSNLSGPAWEISLFAWGMTRHDMKFLFVTLFSARKELLILFEAPSTLLMLPFWAD